MRVLTRSPTAPTPTPSAPAATCVPEPASEAAPTLGRPVGRILTEAQVLTEPVHRAAVDRLPSALRLVAGYHAGWWDAEGRPSPRRGKAVRPALVLACARAVAGAKTTAPTVATAAVTAAVAVELAHDFTLLHDDLMDGDRHRRHRPSAWTVFGAPRATLAGDALVVLALDTLAATPLAPVLTRALLDVCTGQAADMAFEGPAEATVEQCLAMAEGKTGALLGAACHLGALAAGAGAQEADRYRQFGHHLGVAFQLADDLLGIWGEPGVMGKSADADLTARKLTLPVVAALASGTAAGDRLAEVYRQREPLDRHALAGIRELIEAAGGRSWAQEEAGRRAVLALGCLADAGAPTGPDTDLVQLAGLLTRRDR
ncbi:polyprenyl synthetase family protein (plasmid) [Kitasatospora sp. NBC_00070]